jgi:hypothetical protein
MQFDGMGTSRRALILGMTDTDQVGMQQAKAPAAATIPDNAERLADAGDGGDSGGGDGAGVNEMGLTAEEQAEFDRMAQGGDDPEPGPDVAEAGDGADVDDGDIDAEEGTEAPAAATTGKEKTPAELAAETAPGAKPPPRSINFSRHQRELKKVEDRAAAAENEAKKAREDAIKLAERVAIINEALSAPKPQEVDPNAPPANPFDEADIDPSEDYAAAVLQLQRRQRFQLDQTNQIQQETALSQEDSELRSTFSRDAQAFAAQEPAFPAAYQFLKDSRLTEICISQFDKDPNDPNEVFTKQEVETMVQKFNAEEKWVVGTAIKAGKSPAMAIMKLARSRGFKPPAAAAPAAKPAAGPAPGVPAVRNGTGAKPPAAVPSVVDQLADLAAAQDAGRSLSDGGGAPPQGLSAEMLLKLDDEEFAALVDQLPKHQLDTLMGRVPS